MLRTDDNSSPRILVTRDDKLGDVILATPVLESLREAFPSAYIAVLVRPATYEAVRENPFIDEVIVNDKPGWGGIRELAGKLSQRRFDTALVLYNSSPAPLASFMAKIPVRIGPRSRWPMVFLTHRIPQKRSRCEKHEADYNLDLAAMVVPGVEVEPVRNTSIYIDEATRRKVDDLFSELGITQNIPMVGIHPGGGGTSLRWPVKRYTGLIEQLDAQFFITHGPGEEDMVHHLADAGNTYFHPRDYGILEMAEIIRRCKVFVSASTGPMHLASAVKTPVVALFSPVFVCGEKRWGPYSVEHKLLKPDAPSCEHCVEEECTYYDCMDRIPVDKVAEAVRGFLKD